MCFSAEASFALSAGLAAVGVMSLRQAKSPEEKPILAIPLIFAAQQFTEGVLWLQLGTGQIGFLRDLSTHGFLFFAQIIWPALVAPAVRRVETEPQRSRVMKWLTPYGYLIAALLLLRMIIWPYSAEIVGHSIRYESDFKTNDWLVVFYAVAVILPLLLSSRRTLVAFGALVAVSFAISQYFFFQALISVWCFFAAALSTLIFFYARQTVRQNPASASPPL
ncbi:MAG: hypothetical protein EP340_06260 [Alphaproteobacteria bacterium]|nr:MAG: hypothetical protein EP340_06260 [Alphaproteobacteria bacterium]